MKYDFTSIIDRRGRDAIAVDGLKGDGFSPAPPKEGFDAIPMWVADMNFPHRAHRSGSHHRARQAPGLRLFSGPGGVL